MNRRGIEPITTITIIGIVLILIYLITFIPINAFTNLRATINYFVIVIAWFLLQAFFIFGYFKLGELSIKGVGIIKNKVLKWNEQIERYIIVRT